MTAVRAPNTSPAQPMTGAANGHAPDKHHDVEDHDASAHRGCRRHLEVHAEAADDEHAQEYEQQVGARAYAPDAVTGRSTPGSQDRRAPEVSGIQDLQGDEGRRVASGVDDPA